MRSFFKTWKFYTIVAVALVLITLMVRAATMTNSATYMQSAVSTALSPALRLSSFLSDRATDFLASFTSYTKVKKENEELKKEIQQLNSKLVDYNNVMLQNQQYKDYLQLKQENPDLKFMPAMIISRDTDQWNSSFTIDKGSLDGISAKEPIITADGVVGIVTSQVTPTTAVVNTVLDPSCGIGALISRTGDVCVTKGTRELESKGLFGIDYISSDSTVSKGDIVITSGIGGYFPKGLKLATVQNVKIDTNGMQLAAVAQPMVNPAAVKYVSVITDFKGKVAD